MADGGVEILIHVGVDTVEMKGDGFSPKVKVGDKVKKGDLLLEMDLGKIAAAGHPAVVITVVTNTDDFKAVEVVASGDVEPGADLIKGQQVSLDRQKRTLVRASSFCVRLSPPHTC